MNQVITAMFIEKLTNVEKDAQKTRGKHSSCFPHRDYWTATAHLYSAYSSRETQGEKNQSNILL